MHKFILFILLITSVAFALSPPSKLSEIVTLESMQDEVKQLISNPVVLLDYLEESYSLFEPDGEWTAKNLNEIPEDKDDFLGIYGSNKGQYLKGKGEAIFVGDLHGDVQSLYDILRQTNFLERVSAGEDVKLIFFGDYGDRGNKSLEVFLMALKLKELFPEHVVLLRGNHEHLRVSVNNGFFEEILFKFTKFKTLEEINDAISDSKDKKTKSLLEEFADLGEDIDLEELFVKIKKLKLEDNQLLYEAFSVFMAINNLFKELPLFAVTNTGILAVHGGLPVVKHREYELLDLLKGEIPDWFFPIDVLNYNLATQVFWNDPNIGKNKNQYGSIEYRGQLFPEEALLRAKQGMKIKRMARAHEVRRIMGEALPWFPNQSLLSIFPTGLTEFSAYEKFCLNPFYAVVDLSSRDDDWDELKNMKLRSIYTVEINILVQEIFHLNHLVFSQIIKVMWQRIGHLQGVDFNQLQGLVRAV